jgi:hypothetical protein
VPDPVSSVKGAVARTMLAPDPWCGHGSAIGNWCNIAGREGAERTGASANGTVTRSGRTSLFESTGSFAEYAQDI